MSTVASGINFIRNHSMVDILFREITGNNIPHVLIVRNADEFVDQSIGQFGNTAAFFGTGFLLQKVIDKLTKPMQKTLSQAGKSWFRFGKSFAIFSICGSLMYGMPFFRNYVTTKRTGTTDYAQMIGEKQRGEIDDKKLNAVTTNLLHKFFTTVAVGASLAAAFLATGITLAKKGAGMSGLLKFIHQKLSLPEGKFSKLRPWSSASFGVTPAFAGFFVGSRDGYERKEIALRFAAFNFAFFILPHTVERLIEKVTRSMKPGKLLGNHHNIAYMGKFFSSLVLCSAIPSILNIYLTRQRVKRDMAKSSITQFFADPATYTPLKREQLNFIAQPSANYL
ncbi:MAG: hypothetical protein KTR14_03885 [Vampirovibrio sp.]|nr:hypothetical protein [Vampirovibrio sp.]